LLGLKEFLKNLKAKTIMTDGIRMNNRNLLGMKVS